MDRGDFACDLAGILEQSEYVKKQNELFPSPWKIDALDIGEIYITTPEGLHFKLDVHERETSFEDDA